MPTVLITGASRGIGLEFTRQYAADGWKVLACCRNPGTAKELNAVAGDVSVFALDVDSDDAIVALAQQLKSVPIDVLINNAGISRPEATTLGQVSLTVQRSSRPSVRPLIGSVSVAYVNGNWSPG